MMSFPIFRCGEGDGKIFDIVNGGCVRHAMHRLGRISRDILTDGLSRLFRHVSSSEGAGEAFTVHELR